MEGSLEVFLSFLKFVVKQTLFCLFVTGKISTGENSLREGEQLAVHVELRLAIYDWTISV